MVEGLSHSATAPAASQAVMKFWNGVWGMRHGVGMCRAPHIAQGMAPEGNLASTKDLTTSAQVNQLWDPKSNRIKNHKAVGCQQTQRRHCCHLD